LWCANAISLLFNEERRHKGHRVNQIATNNTMKRCMKMRKEMDG
jgi:hypothetical protein